MSILLEILLIVKGEITKLLLTKKEIKQYINQLRNILEAYRERLKWLLSGMS